VDCVSDSVSVDRAAAFILSFFHSDSHERILCLRPPFIIRLESAPVPPPLAFRFTRRHHPRRVLIASTCVLIASLPNHPAPSPPRP
jgi:hypothetical protein